MCFRVPALHVVMVTPRANEKKHLILQAKYAIYFKDIVLSGDDSVNDILGTWMVCIKSDDAVTSNLEHAN